MAHATSGRTPLDTLGMVVGGGLVLLGTVVFGFFETVLGTPHAIPVADEAGRIVTHTTFSMELRAGIIALGLLVLTLFAVVRFVAAPPGGG